jgi:hypothetical protein
MQRTAMILTVSLFVLGNSLAQANPPLVRSTVQKRAPKRAKRVVRGLLALAGAAAMTTALAHPPVLMMPASPAPGTTYAATLNTAPSGAGWAIAPTTVIPAHNAKTTVFQRWNNSLFLGGNFTVEVTKAPGFSHALVVVKGEHGKQATHDAMTALGVTNTYALQFDRSGNATFTVPASQVDALVAKMGRPAHK